LMGQPHSLRPRRAAKRAVDKHIPAGELPLDYATR
jgi:hypothetical protein